MGDPSSLVLARREESRLDKARLDTLRKYQNLLVQSKNNKKNILKKLVSNQAKSNHVQYRFAKSRWQKSGKDWLLQKAIKFARTNYSKDFATQFYHEISQLSEKELRNVCRKLNILK